ncbi:MAG: hypothetical protein ACREOK_01980 [Gemmatimonadaceae bacterium]
MNRRSIIVLLIGAIAALAGFGFTAWMRQRRCAGAGGVWRHQTRECMTAAGERIDAAAISDVIIGVVVAIGLAFMLFRVLLFVMGRMPRRST